MPNRYCWSSDLLFSWIVNHTKSKAKQVVLVETIFTLFFVIYPPMLLILSGHCFWYKILVECMCFLNLSVANSLVEPRSSWAWNWTVSSNGQRINHKVPKISMGIALAPYCPPSVSGFVTSWLLPGHLVQCCSGASKKKRLPAQNWAARAVFGCSYWTNANEMHTGFRLVKHKTLSLLCLNACSIIQWVLSSLSDSSARVLWLFLFWDLIVREDQCYLHLLLYGIHSQGRRSLLIIKITKIYGRFTIFTITLTYALFSYEMYVLLVWWVQMRICFEPILTCEAFKVEDQQPLSGS